MATYRIRDQVYYSVKPWMPTAIRLMLRRWRARRLRADCAETWPIDSSSGQPPQGWPGWPDGKRFGFLLTHDVETSYGLSKVDALAEVESGFERPFRSAFYFVPERYQTPCELRSRLIDKGFEVGVHGLTHDGKLFRSKAEFERRAQRINHYLRDWGGVGFRAPLMHHNLEWQHALAVDYDASTFDTDPFEPQPDGVRSVFPFWVSGRSAAGDHGDAGETGASRRGGRTAGPGYWEFPYSLPQDFTLFIVLRHRDARLWMQKLDWVAKHGGMALVDVHPDYVNLGGGWTQTGYPVELYRVLLRYVQDRYGDDCWHGLPKELVAYLDQHWRVPE